MTTNLQLETIELTDTIKGDFVRKMNSNNAKLDSAYNYLRDNLLETTGEHDLVSAIEDYKNDFQNITQPLQETIEEQEQTIEEQEQTIEEQEQTINTLSSIGDATTNEIVSGKTALVQGQTITGSAFGTTTTATTDDISIGKTAYSNDGTLLTGTLNAITNYITSCTFGGLYWSSSYFDVTEGNYGYAVAPNGDVILWAKPTTSTYENIRWDYSTSLKSGVSIKQTWAYSTSYTSGSPNIVQACVISGIKNSTTISASFSYLNSNYDYVGVTLTIS